MTNVQEANREGDQCRCRRHRRVGWSRRQPDWNAVIELVEQLIGRTYTRQGLNKIEAIRTAYVSRRTSLKHSAPRGEQKALTAEEQMLMDRIARLEAENARLTAQNELLMEQFARWAYNARRRGLDSKVLNSALPPVHRDGTPAKRR